MTNSHTVRVWSTLAALTFATFLMGTSEFAPMGVLSDIASDLAASPSSIGNTVSLYAWVSAISSLASLAFTHKTGRKSLTIAIVSVLAVSSILTALSGNVTLFAVCRFLGACAHGIFWATVAATATQLAPKEYLSAATALVFGGLSLSTVVGVPLVNYLGQLTHWQTPFVLIGGLSAITCLVLWRIMPHMAIHDSTASVRDVKRVLSQPYNVFIYLTTALITVSHFIAFTYLDPFLRHVPSTSPEAVSLSFFYFGIAGVLGNIVSGIYNKHNVTTVIAVATSLNVVAFFEIGLRGHQADALERNSMLVLWGLSISALFTSLQTWVLSANKQRPLPASALHTTVLNASIGAGAMMGGGLIPYITSTALFTCAALPLIAALSLVMYVRYQLQKQH